MVGTTISHYNVIEKIGHGGLGEVYRAEDTHLSLELAIKVVRTGLWWNKGKRVKEEWNEQA